MVAHLGKIKAQRDRFEEEVKSKELEIQRLQEVVAGIMPETTDIGVQTGNDDADDEDDDDDDDDDNEEEPTEYQHGFLLSQAESLLRRRAEYEENPVRETGASGGVGG